MTNPTKTYNKCYLLWQKLQLKDFCKKCTIKNIDRRYNTVFTNSAIHGVIKQSDYFEKDVFKNYFERKTLGYFESKGWFKDIFSQPEKITKLEDELKAAKQNASNLEMKLRDSQKRATDSEAKLKEHQKKVAD